MFGGCLGCFWLVLGLFLAVFGLFGGCFGLFWGCFGRSDCWVRLACWAGLGVLGGLGRLPAAIGAVLFSLFAIGAVLAWFLPSLPSAAPPSPTPPPNTPPPTPKAGRGEIGTTMDVDAGEEGGDDGGLRVQVGGVLGGFGRLWGAFGGGVGGCGHRVGCAAWQGRRSPLRSLLGAQGSKEKLSAKPHSQTAPSNCP